MSCVSDVESNVINKNASDTARMSQMMNILIISYICHSLFPELDAQSLHTTYIGPERCQTDTDSQIYLGLSLRFCLFKSVSPGYF